MNFLKRNKFLIGGAAIVLLVLVLLEWQFIQTKNEIKKTGDELSNRLANFYRDSDSKLENAENRILKLKEEGFVEADEFSDVSQRIINSTVLVGSSSEKIATGFFVRQDGYIVTAKHAVDAIGHNNIIVLDSSGRRHEARVVDLDEVSDMALLKVNGTGFPAVPFGYFDNLQVGDEIGFVGFSLNTSTAKPLVYRGVVSAKETDGKGAKMFSINAFVNKGNSGGPVFSAKTGRVVGMVSARQKDASSERYLNLPPNYQSGLVLGGVDPLKFNVDLYNKTVDLVSDVSQVGVGIVFSLDRIGELIDLR